MVSWNATPVLGPVTSAKFYTTAGAVTTDIGTGIHTVTVGTGGTEWGLVITGPCYLHGVNITTTTANATTLSRGIGFGTELETYANTAIGAMTVVGPLQCANVTFSDQTLYLNSAVSLGIRFESANVDGIYTIQLLGGNVDQR